MVVGGFHRIFSEDLFISTYRNKARITCVYTINLLVREFCFGETLAGLDEPTKMFPAHETALTASQEMPTFPGSASLRFVLASPRLLDSCMNWLHMLSQRMRGHIHCGFICCTVLGAMVLGCAGPAIRSQSPELEALVAVESATQLVGDYASPWGLNSQRIERAALITGLPDTGSDPPPDPRRQMLLEDMQARGVVDPNHLLASRSTALAWVSGTLHPGIRKGERFDVIVEVPGNHDTTSLSGGWLMEARLVEMAVLGNRIRDGHTLGVAEGPLLIDPVSIGAVDSIATLRGRVPGGGVSLTSRSIGLSIHAEHRSVGLSKRIGDCINQRFHAIIRGVKRGVATPKTDRFIELQVPEVYRNNLGRYVSVVRSLAVAEPSGNRHARLELLSRQLGDPVTAPRAALRLEAIGKEAIGTLREGLESTDAEVRFVSAEALAYLGESLAAEKLAEASRDLRSARPKALAALAILDDANGIDALRSLLDSRSAETRYGAFRGLSMIDPSLPDIRGDMLGEACRLHVIDVSGEPLIHATRAARAEVVLFGDSHPVSNGLRVEAGPSIVVVVEENCAVVSCFRPDEPDLIKKVDAQVEDILHAIVECGGGYPDVIQFLQQATAKRSMQSRLAFDAIPTEFDGRLSVSREVVNRNQDTKEEDDQSEGDESRDDSESYWPSLFDTALLEAGA